MSIRKKIRTLLNIIYHLSILDEKTDKGRGKPVDRYFSYQKKYINFNIKNGDKVLDIGSGAYPFLLATHLADFYEDSTPHRGLGSDNLVKDDRPFTNCSVEALPFSNKEFDFIYCSHVLEHVDDPSKACNELMRVGKRGYIETPSKISDIMLNFARHKDMHKWHTHIIENTIVFLEYRDNERKDTNTDSYYMDCVSEKKNIFQDMFYENLELFYNMMQWDEKFNYIIINKKGQIIKSTV